MQYQDGGADVGRQQSAVQRLIGHQGKNIDVDPGIWSLGMQFSNILLNEEDYMELNTTTLIKSL